MTILIEDQYLKLKRIKLLMKVNIANKFKLTPLWCINIIDTSTNSIMT
jgi:hypothetical protein